MNENVELSDKEVLYIFDHSDLTTDVDEIYEDPMGSSRRKANQAFYCAMHSKSFPTEYVLSMYINMLKYLKRFNNQN